jgi:YHS domain-containing protein
MNSIAATPRTAVDPVCGMKVDPQSSDIMSTYGQNDYYFCANACRKVFDDNPEKYLKDISEKPKGFWKRYLERLNKTTGGKTPKCCG